LQPAQLFLKIRYFLFCSLPGGKGNQDSVRKRGQ
jgi:hypothetical protein